MTTDHMIQSENSLGYVRVKHAESPRYLIEESVLQKRTPSTSTKDVRHRIFQPNASGRGFTHTFWISRRMKSSRAISRQKSMIMQKSVGKVMAGY